MRQEAHPGAPLFFVEYPDPIPRIQVEDARLIGEPSATKTSITLPLSFHSQARIFPDIKLTIGIMYTKILGSGNVL
jgi:hypothetical protein